MDQKKIGLTQKQLVQQLSVTDKSVSKREKGVSRTKGY